MKKFYSIMTMFFLLFVNSISIAAEEQATPIQTPQQPPVKPAKDMGMMADDEQLKMMQEHILAMHDLSNKILAETDPAKKEQLKQQQRDLMKTYHVSMMGHRPPMQP